jgi:NAD(P)-dependent dehydrogenase (short-subunit alcohol dehydrogenase family)
MVGDDRTNVLGSSDEPRRPVALVTGASRGIGSHIAQALAVVGFDVAITARTMREGEGRGGRAHSDPPEATPATLAGSLETTARSIQAKGVQALPIVMDMLEPASVIAGVESTLAHFGRIDALVNNAVYRGPGAYDPLVGTPIDCFSSTMQANFLSQALLTQQVLAAMLNVGRGTIVNMSSIVVAYDPPGPLGSGGWGFGYATSKAAFDRMAGLINAEHSEEGIVAFNVEPGFVQHADPFMQTARSIEVEATPPEAIAAAVAWLILQPKARQLRSLRIHLPELCRQLNLLPEWKPLDTNPPFVPRGDIDRMTSAITSVTGNEMP